MINLKDITKIYKMPGGTEVRALKGITLNFGKSEFVSILGPSGCGKTTLLNIIGGLDGFEGGDLLVDGVSVKNFTDRDRDAYRNRSVGFIFQNYNLISHLNILQNVLLAPSLKGESRSECVKKSRAALEKVGLGDQLNKKPSQLSGGQMQRVAIARAIVNDPDIILADEPTGALDTETGDMIAGLLKEISKEKLVIVVTHNRELAEKYSTRIVQLRDGALISDSNPVEGEQTCCDAVRVADVTGVKKPRMTLFTALGISVRSLWAKKWRTFWTSFAGSIGIFGIAIVLALSSGMNTYAYYMQAQAAGDSYITISETGYDANNLNNLIEDVADDVPYPENTTGVIPYRGRRLNNLLVSNNLTDDYIDYIENINPSWTKSISYTYSVTLNVLQKDAAGNYVKRASWASYGKQMTATGERVESNYDVLYKLGDGGENGYSGDGYPSDITEVSVVVDRYNRLSVSALEALGLMQRNGEELPKEVPYTDIVGKEYSLILNDGWYVEKANGTFGTIAASAYKSAAEGENALKLKIVSVLRPKSDKADQWLQAGLAYLPELTEFIVENSRNSIVGSRQLSNREVNVRTGSPFVSSDYGDVTKEQAYISALKALGAYAVPTSVRIYPTDTITKAKITEYLNEWNSDHPGEEVIFTDLTEAVAGALNLLVNVVSLVLIAFSAISLVVSTVMISVITYSSVVTRTREIGILRSLGARKADIAGIFNGETLIIGAIAGVLGVVIAVIAGAIVNAVLAATLNVTQLVNFTWGVAAGMIALSVGLTLLAGLVPAIIAARKKPVVCLRSE